MGDDLDVTAEAAEPRGDIGGIGDGAGEQEELQIGRRGEQRAFVVVAARRVGEPVVFVHDEKLKGREIGGAGGDIVT